MGRRTAPAIALAALLFVFLSTLSARASSSEESSFVSRINAERTSRGIRAVSTRSDLIEVARWWSQQMAAAGQIWHDPNMPNEVSGWTALGDNVGRGPSVASLHDAFMNSSEHRSIILDPTYNQVGVGVYDAGDTIYVTEVFVRRTSTTARHAHVAPRPTYSALAPRRAVVHTSPGTYVLDLTGVIWGIDLGGDPRTVSVLEQLVGLDAPRVDPATGDAR
jgi:hypothetical protein